MTGCLYDDLLAAIDLYTSMLQKNPTLEAKFREAVNALLIPEVTTLVWETGDEK
jgi:hypothetical protein